MIILRSCSLFFFTDPATTEIYPLSLHDALPISLGARFGFDAGLEFHVFPLLAHAAFDFLATHPLLGFFSGALQKKPRSGCVARKSNAACARDRKSTRLNSSHGYISYAVFCLKKK